MSLLWKLHSKIAFCSKWSNWIIPYKIISSILIHWNMNLSVNLVAPLFCEKVSLIRAVNHDIHSSLWLITVRKGGCGPADLTEHGRLLLALPFGPNPRGTTRERLPVLTLLYQLRQGCTTSGSSMPCSSMYQMLKLKLGPQDIRGTAGKSGMNVRPRQMSFNRLWGKNLFYLFWQICRGTSAHRSCALT